MGGATRVCTYDRAGMGLGEGLKQAGAVTSFGNAPLIVLSHGLDSAFRIGSKPPLDACEELLLRHP